LADRLHDLWVIPLRCPGCGADLPVTGSEALYHCPPCGSGWELTGESLVPREIGHVAGADLVERSGERVPMRRLPFWVFPFSVTMASGEARTLAAYQGLSGNITPISAARGERPPLVFVPAFSALPAQLLRAGRLLTLRNPPLTLASGRPVDITPIVFRETDARVLAETLVLATMTEERRLSATFLDSFTVRTGTGRLLTIAVQEREGRLLVPELRLEI